MTYAKHVQRFTRLLSRVVSENRQDLIVVAALVLWAGGWWSIDVTYAKAVAVSLPALVLVFYALPSRPPFILREGKDRT